MRSATVQDAPRDDGQASITVEGNDFIATAIEQSRWSRYAAWAAAFAAFPQAAGLLFPAPNS